MAVRVVNSGPDTIKVSVKTTPAVSVSAPAVSPVNVSVQGLNGIGVPTGGDEGAILRKNSGTDYDTGWTPYSLPAADGLERQVLVSDGEGALTFDYVRSTYLKIQNDNGSVMPAGTPVYPKGITGDRVLVGKALCGDSSKMPAIGVLLEETANGGTGYIITAGNFNKTVSGLSGVVAGQKVYVSATGTLTNVRPTGSTNLVQNIGTVLQTSGGNIQKMKVSAIDRSNDIPNLAEGYIWIGNASGVSQPTLLSSISSSQNFSNTNLTVTGDRTHNLALNDVNFVQSSGGTSVMYLDGPSARVGINTTSPNVPLHVHGTGSLVQIGNVQIDADGNFKKKSGSGITPSMAFKASDNTKMTLRESSPGTITFDVLTGGTVGAETSTEVVRILGTTTAGQAYVGIGTTTPSSNLHVVGDVRVEGDLTVNGSYTQIDTDVLTTEQWNVTNDGTGPAVTINQKGAQDIMDVQDDGVSVFYIEDGGNVGIGTTSPLQKLHLKDGADVNLQIGAVSSELQLKATNDADTAYIPMILRASEFNILSGNVGIGTTSPAQALHVVGNIRLNSSTNAIYSNRFTALSNADVQLRSYDGYNLILNGDTGDNVGIGTTSPATKLEVAGVTTVRKSGIATAHADTDLLVTDATAGLSTAQVQILGGNAGSSNLKFSDTDSYSVGSIDYSHSADSMSFRTNNTIQTTITSTGNVGIGTTSPDYLLDVAGSARIQTSLNFAGTGGSDSTWKIEPNNANADLQINEIGVGSRMYFKSGGNVGIGTTSPSQKLEVDGFILLQNNDEIRFKDSVGTERTAIELDPNNDLNIGTSAGGNLKFINGSAYTERMRIDSSGRVGIGTTSPSAKLDVSGGDINLPLGNHIRFGGELGVQKVSNGSMNFFAGTNSTSGGFNFSTWNGSTYDSGTVVIRNSGNVGIGTTSPSKKLHISGGDALIQNATASNTFLDVKGTSSNAYIRAYSDSNSVWLYQGGNSSYLQAQSGSTMRVGSGTGNLIFSDTSGEVMRTSSGNVGIGTTTPGTNLDVVGNIRLNTVGNQLEFSNANVALQRDNAHRLEIGGYDGIIFKSSNTTINNQTERMRITSAGNVGIGTTSPDTELHVESGDAILTLEGSNSSYVNAAIQLVSNHASNLRGMGTFAYTAHTDVEWFWGNPYSNNDAFVINRNTGYTVPSSQNSPPGIGASAGTLFKVASSGNVGIGTTSPSQKLQVSGGDIMIDSDYAMHFTSTADFTKIQRSNNALQFFTNSTAMLSLNDSGSGYFNGSGNFGIGTTSPASPLHVYSNNTATGTSGGLTIEQDGAGDAILQFLLTGTKRWVVGIDNNDNRNFKISGTSDLGTDNGLTIENSTYNVGIGTTTPSAKLDVVGLANINDGSNNVMISSGNTAMAGAANTAVGHQAGFNNTSGVSNAFVGLQAGFNNTIGNDNSFFGRSAGFSNTIGDSNSFVGIYAGYSNTSGANNSFFGRDAGYYSTGSANVLIGYEAGYGSATSAYSNTVAVGYQALQDLTTGGQNTAVGHQAFTNITTGANNTAVGYQAGSANILGDSNSFFGVYAGVYTTGSANTAIGHSANFYNTTGSNNVAIGRSAAFGASGASTFSNTVAVGYQALYGLTTGAQNTAVGYRALTNITTPNDNTAVGYQAGYTNIIGSSNSLFGTYAGYSNTGSSNTAVGYAANFYNTTGNYNVAIGRSAAFGATGSSTFSNTVAVGYQALTALTIGENNVAVGFQAGLSNTEGDDNVFVGGFAGQANTTGDNNAFVGRNAGYANISGSVNSFLGVSAGRYNTTGYSNTFLGGLAGNQNTIGYSNSFVGVNAGYSNTSGDNNSFFGRDSGYSNSTGNGNIFLGYKAGYYETLSNKLYIANSDTTTPLIYGDFSLGEITINGDLNVSGGNLRADAVEINGRALTTPATGEYGAGSRLVTQFASGTVTAGKVYVANAGSWAEGDANAGSTSIGMIAVATDAASATEMLIEGVIKLSSNTGFSGAAAGTVLYLSTTAGELTTTAPSTAGEYVRVCGYVVNASTNEVFFSPSKDWTAL